MKKSSFSSIILGASFLMATSAIGPGFLMQTTVFTKQLLASFGFVILLSVILDVFAQLNIWRVLTVSGKRAQDVASETLAGSGYVLALLIVFGGLAFNIGNVAGAGLGLEILFGIDVKIGAALSAIIGNRAFYIQRIRQSDRRVCENSRSGNARFDNLRRFRIAPAACRSCFENRLPGNDFPNRYRDAGRRNSRRLYYVCRRTSPD
jgi:Mn2+/Fe2+ NRAMP family transporter